MFIEPQPGPDQAAARERRFGPHVRIGAAILILLAAITAACIVMVPAGEAMVITRFGNPVRVLTQPGLAWKLPAPIESAIPIDLRLRTTATGLQDVGTRDGLRVLVQAYVAWQVPGSPNRVRQFLRSVRNNPNVAAVQLRSFVNAALHIISSNFKLSSLVNLDPNKVRLNKFEQQIQAQIAPRMLKVYGIAIRQVGIERMTLPDQTLAATVARMRAERETVAAERTAAGLREAAKIRANADRNAREVVAQAREHAARTEANAEEAAAGIYAKAYRSDPGLYTTLRSLDAISKMIGRNANVVLRTDSAPFDVLVKGPVGLNLARSSAANRDRRHHGTTGAAARTLALNPPSRGPTGSPTPSGGSGH